MYIGNDLDRVIDVDCLVNVTPDHEETFFMDTLGNRTGDQTLTDGTVNFTVQSSTNRYTSIGGNAIAHDFAGNMTTDKDDYEYFYDYENRLVRIEDSSSVEVATHDYDALGRRIRVIDKSADPDVTTLYYYNPEWQVLAEYNGAGAQQRYYVYGNYIDEPLVMSDGTDDYYYVQDHLYSTVALIGYVDSAWTVVERYEYDAYGKVTVHTDDGDDDIWFTADDTIQGYSAQGNPYTFTGRRLDVLDDGNLLTMYYRYRTYDTYTGRFLTQDLLVAFFNGYVDGMNAYAYAINSPSVKSDPLGLSDEDAFVGCLKACVKKFTGYKRFVCVIRCYKGYSTGWQIPKYDIEGILKSMLPTDPSVKVSILHLKLIEVPTPYGTFTVEADATLSAENCKKEDGTSAIQGSVDVTVDAKMCFGPGYKFPMNPVLKKITPVLSTGCKKCGEYVAGGSVSLEIEGKAGAVITGSITGTVDLYPNSGKLGGKLKIEAGNYMGAQICVGVSGNAYLTDYVK